MQEFTESSYWILDKNEHRAQCIWEEDGEVEVSFDVSHNETNKFLGEYPNRIDTLPLLMGKVNGIGIATLIKPKSILVGMTIVQGHPRKSKSEFVVSSDLLIGGIRLESLDYCFIKRIEIITNDLPDVLLSNYRNPKLDKLDSILEPFTKSFGDSAVNLIVSTYFVENKEPYQIKSYPQFKIEVTFEELQDINSAYDYIRGVKSLFEILDLKVFHFGTVKLFRENQAEGFDLYGKIINSNFEVKPSEINHKSVIFNNKYSILDANKLGNNLCEIFHHDLSKMLVFYVNAVNTKVLQIYYLNIMFAWLDNFFEEKLYEETISSKDEILICKIKELEVLSNKDKKRVIKKLKYKYRPAYSEKIKAIINESSNEEWLDELLKSKSAMIEENWDKPYDKLQDIRNNLAHGKSKKISKSELDMAEACLTKIAIRRVFADTGVISNLNQQ
jgi:hypothetical protein